MTLTTKSVKSGHHPDYFLAALVVILTVSGLVILASASSDIGQLKFGDSYYYLKHQITYGLSLGFIGFLIASKLHYQHYRKFAFLLLFLTIVLLTLVFTKFGITTGGASRWLKFGPLTFQPAELLKLTFVIYLAAWLANPKMKRTTDFIGGTLPFFVISGFIGGLLFLQPATSTVFVLIGTGFVMYFLSGAEWRHILAVGLLAAVIVGLLVWSTPYRRARIATFLDSTRDVEGAGFQVNQAKIAIGSGQIFGIGYGKSTSKVNVLPSPFGDSIFAVFAQEFGFVGAGGLVILFGLLVFRLLWLAMKVRDRFGQLLLVGFATIIAFQSLVNMGAISGFLPLTGVPLPFVSFGGTALAVFLVMSGIAVNVSKYT